MNSFLKWCYWKLLEKFGLPDAMLVLGDRTTKVTITYIAKHRHYCCFRANLVKGSESYSRGDFLSVTDDGTVAVPKGDQ